MNPSRSILSITRKHPAAVRSFLSLIPPGPLRRRSIVQQMLRGMSGLHFTVRTKLDNRMPVTVFLGDVIGDQIYSYGIFEPETVHLLGALLDKDTVFFDVGAHIGQYTLMAACFAREVHSFEPMPWIYDILESNIKTNTLTNVVANPIGIMDYTGRADVWEGPEENSGSGSFLRIPDYYVRSHPVDCTTLDLYCETRDLHLRSRKILIKIDAERAELNVLRGAVRLFGYEPTFIVEFNDWSDDLEDIVRLFEERKYSLHAISYSGLQNGFTIEELFPQRRQSKYVNVLAKPPQA